MDVWRWMRGPAISGLCTVVAYPLYPHFDPVNIVMIYLLGTTVAGLALGRGPAALTAVINTAAFDYFFVPPRYSFYVSETQYLFTLSVMLGVALIIANLMASVRRQTQVADERERRTAKLYAMSRELAVAADATMIARAAAKHVAASVDGSVVVLLPGPAGGELVPRSQSESTVVVPDLAVARRVLAQNQLHGDAQLYLPLACGAQALGVMLVQSTRSEPFRAEQRALLGALAGQIGLALERARLAEVAAESRAAAERAALRNTLLASISHDLRGPLSAIAGAGSLVAQSSASLDRHKRRTLGHLIEEKARDMSDLLTNVLELMRLETQAGALRSDWQSLEELAGIAIRTNEHRFGERSVASRIPSDFPMVHVDGRLTVQLLSNLLENATRHTPPGTSISIRAEQRAQQAVVTVEDDGPGFGDRDPETLFEKFERGQKESHVSGVGLGLAICRAIVHLHGGEIRARNRDPRGAAFELTLPLRVPGGSEGDPGR